MHETGSVRYVRYTNEAQRKRLSRSLPEELVDAVTGKRWPAGTTHRIDQDSKLNVLAHAVCEDEYEVELAEHLRVAHGDVVPAHVVAWSSFDSRTLCDVVLSTEDIVYARDKGLHVDALKCARKYFTVPSFSLASRRPGSIRHALKVQDFCDTAGCGSGPHCALYDALTMREVCRCAVKVLREETDGNMTMRRFLGIEESVTPPPALADKHNLVPTQANAAAVKSDIDKVFDLQRQMDGAHEAWMYAHKNARYWDEKGKLFPSTSKEFKSQVRKIMGNAWSSQNGHRLNATRTKDGVLRLLARAAQVV